MKSYVSTRRHSTHFYVQDYMSNVRMVLNSNGTVEQKTHYYPYGGVIGNLSTNHDHQLLKYNLLLNDFNQLNNNGKTVPE